MSTLRLSFVLILLGNYVCLYTSSFTEQFASAQSQYEIAMKKLIAVYNAQRPAKPVVFNQSDVLGATFARVVRPYVAELSGYAGVVMSAFARDFPYHNNLKILQEKFNEYNTKIEKLSKQFPEMYQKSALHFFYNQLTASVLQNCVKIVQHISFVLSTKKEDIDSAKMAYNLAWAVQTPDMKAKNFTSVKEFQRNMTKWMIAIYQAAVSKLTDQLQQVENKQELYGQIAQYYEAMAQIYTDVEDQQNAAVEIRNAQKAKQSANECVQAKKIVLQAVKLAGSGRSPIIIDFDQPSSTKAVLTKSLQDLQEAQKLYGNALKMYTALQDNAAVNSCTAKINELSGDTHIRGIQLLWILFLQDTYRVSSEVKSHAVLKAFYATDPIHNTINFKEVDQALNDLFALCTKAPNNFNESLAVLPLLLGAIKEYQAGTTGHPHAHSKDRLADIAVLQDLQKVVHDFVEIIQHMLVLGQLDVNHSPSSNTTQAVMLAKHIDTALQKNSLLKDLFINFAQFNMQATEQKSMISFVMQYVYRVALSRVVLHTSQSEADPQLLLQDLLYLIVLQEYKSYMTEEQWNQVEVYTKKVVLLVGLNNQLANAYQKARSRNRWQNSAKKNEAYQSVSATLWQNSLQLYQVAIQLSLMQNADDYNLPATAELQNTYIKILQEYIEAFLQKGPKTSGYQLYIVSRIYELYIVAEHVQNNAAQSYAQTTLQSLFAGKQGFFDMLQTMQAGHQAQSVALVDQKDGTDTTLLLSTISLALIQQEQMLAKIVSMFDFAKQPEPLLQKTIAGDLIVVTMKFAGQSYTAQIMNPKALARDYYAKQAEDLLTSAQQEEKKLQYAQAMKIYGELEQIYLKILPLVSNAAQEISYKDKYFLAKTRYSATSLASQVTITGDATLGKMTKIPSQYYAVKYVQHGLDLTKINTPVPSALQRFTKLTVMETDQARALALELLKAFMISEILDQQGVKFADCFIDYQLQEKGGLSKDNQDIVTSVVSKVTNYLGKIDAKATISLFVTGNIITMQVEQMPIPAVTSLYPGGPNAGIYFSGAATLFAPGQKLLQIGGVSYVPGQDEQSMNQMYQDAAYAYLSEAQQTFTAAQALGTQLIAELTKQVKAGKNVDEGMFNKQYNEMKKKYVQSQSLLFAQGGSAYYYFEQAKDSSKAEEVKEAFFVTYQDQIAQLKQLLIGNPTGNLYSMVISDLNQAYLAWTSELDPHSDADQIASNQNAIVDLFKTAAQQCASYKYIDAMFPSYKQVHYMAAASDYQAASTQYKNMQENGKAADMQAKVMDSYFAGCVQNVMLYFSAQKKGITYTPEQVVGQVLATPRKITFNQLLVGYQQFQTGGDSSPGIINSYSKIKNLLIDASMLFQLVGNYYGKMVPSAAAQSVSPHGKAKPKASVNPDLLKYLHDNNIITSQLQNIAYTQKGMIKKLFSNAQTIYNHFKNNPEALGNWCNILNMAIAHQYINDFEGGATASNFSRKYMQFFQAVQKETSSLQNNSSAYIG